MKRRGWKCKMPYSHIVKLILLISTHLLLIKHWFACSHCITLNKAHTELACGTLHNECTSLLSALCCYYFLLSISTSQHMSTVPWCHMETGDMTSLPGHPPLFITSGKSCGGGLGVWLHKQPLLSESVPGSRHPQFSEIRSLFYLKSCSLFSMFTESRMNKGKKQKSLTSLYCSRK